MDKKRKIIHIDMDAFYASVEQRDNPEFRGHPLVVGGRPESRGVVAACSYEARKFGIHSAMPCSKAARLCQNLIFTRPRLDRYREVSIQIMSIFRKYTDIIEPLSLDEAFLDVTSNSLQQPSATIIANQIREDIYSQLGLTSSAGVSFNKFIAKVASDINKPNGITIVPPDRAIEFIANLPIGKFFGVGKVTEKKMFKLGILKGEDLRKYSEDALTFHFGKSGGFLYDIVRGIDNRPVEPRKGRKSIGSETTLSKDTKDLPEINAILSSIADKVGNALSKKKCGGYTLTLKIRYHDFVTISRSHTAKVPLYNSTDILNILPRLLLSCDAGDKKVRLLGLSLSKLVEEDSGPKQLLLPFVSMLKHSRSK